MALSDFHLRVSLLYLYSTTQTVSPSASQRAVLLTYRMNFVIIRTYGKYTAKKGISIMKKLLFLFCLGLLLTSCGRPDANNEADNIDDTKTKTIISTLDYTNKGKMGDTDGPAFAVYSNLGYTGASAALDLANMEINTVLPSGKFVNGYAFFGIDVYNKTGSWWQNCVDVGLCWSGRNGGWHVFYNMYEPLNEKTPTWYESKVILPKDDIYNMSLTLTEDNYAILTVEGQNSGIRDEVRVEVKGAYADGHNTAFLFNTALDYPPNTKVDRDGQRCEDFVEITLANSDKGLFLKSFHVEALTLYKRETTFPWTNDKSSAVSIWPDKSVAGFDYAPTAVETFDGTEYVIDLDMNR